MKRLQLFIFLVLTSMMSLAQNYECAADEVHKQLLLEDKLYAQLVEKYNKEWSKFVKNKQSTKISASDSEEIIYEIPVVFHIIHTGQTIGKPENPSEQVLVDLIKEINQKFSATWPAYPSVSEGGVNIPIQFKLAQRDPECQPTNGIIRVDGSNLQGYLENGLVYNDDLELKSLSRWPNTEYMNVWIVTNIVGSSASGGNIGGYSTLPGSSSIKDGIVLKCNQLGALTHEVGHFLGLRHTFQGSTETECPVNDDCTVDGDMVCDTDPHLLLPGCPTSVNNCTGNSLVPVVHNIMNYGSCRNRFSIGQKERMLYMLLNERNSLLYSYGAAPIGEEINISLPKAAACVPLGITGNNSTNMGIVNVNLADLNVSSNGYIGDGTYYVDHTIPSCLKVTQYANLKISESYEISVRNGSLYKENVRAWIDFNNDGFFDSTEVIMTSMGTEQYQTHKATFQVPSTATVNTSLRMRVASDFFNLSIPEPCGELSFGQIEDYIVFITDNLETNESSELHLYPNPVSDILNLSEKLEDIEIYAIDRRRVMTFNSSEQINVDNLAVGVYIIKGKNVLGKSVQATFIKN